MKGTLGNKSKNAPTWIGGHTQDLKPQHVPGYSGHVPGVASENLYSKTFGEVSAKAIARDHVLNDKEAEIKNRFTTSTKEEFNEDKHRRLHDPNERRRIECKDDDEYNEYFKYFGFDVTELYRQETEKRAIDELPTVGYKGYKSAYRKNMYKSVGNNPLVNFNVGPLTAKLKKTIYEDVSELPEYQNISKGF